MPAPEEFQARITELMSAHFAGSVEFSDEPIERPDPLVFDKLPRDIKAYLDRFVIKQDEAKKVLSVALCDHYNHVRLARESGRSLLLMGCSSSVYSPIKKKGIIEKLSHMSNRALRNAAGRSPQSCFTALQKSSEAC